MSKTQKDKLKHLRGRIDSVDSELLALLRRRAEIVANVGKIKRRSGKGSYDPERERAILGRLLREDHGVLTPAGIQAIFREILSASRALEGPLNVAYFGPEASFTHLASLRYFGSSATFLPKDSIGEVFEAVEQEEVQYGVVPVENSIEGTVGYTLDLFIDTDLKISAEVPLKISHNLLSKTGRVKDIKKIYSIPQAIAQCRNWLKNHMPGVLIHDVANTARAAQIAQKDGGAAAIASEMACEVYMLKFVQKGIEDYPNNFTRFLVLGYDEPEPGGEDKTSIVFSLKDEAGALYNALKPFEKYNINLTKIESRPIKKKAWEYVFFVDLDGHIKDRKIKLALEKVSRNCLFLKILGSYPKSR